MSVTFKVLAQTEESEIVLTGKFCIDPITQLSTGTNANTVHHHYRHLLATLPSRFYSHL